VDTTTWEVESIKAKRWAKGVLQYQVKWTDHPESSNTWEPLGNLCGAEAAIADFEKEWERHYNAPIQRKRARTPTSASPATPLEEAQAEHDDSLNSTVEAVVDLAENLSGD
jgi:hypothetical protein